MNRRLRSTAGGAALAVVATYACVPSSDVTLVPDRAPSDGGGVALVRDDADEIPCAPRQVLHDVCQQCHARPTRNGAPFPLERRSDVLGSYEGNPIRDDMIAQLEARRMPLTPVTIDDAGRDVLLAWLRAGAPAVVPTSCHEVDAGTAPDADAAPPPPAAPDADVPPDAGAEPPPDDAGP